MCLLLSGCPLHRLCGWHHIPISGVPWFPENRNHMLLLPFRLRVPTLHFSLRGPFLYRTHPGGSVLWNGESPPGSYVPVCRKHRLSTRGCSHRHHRPKFGRTDKALPTCRSRPIDLLARHRYAQLPIRFCSYHCSFVLFDKYHITVTLSETARSSGVMSSDSSLQYMASSARWIMRACE